jgi:hypothetical protein
LFEALIRRAPQVSPRRGSRARTHVRDALIQFATGTWQCRRRSGTLWRVTVADDSLSSSDCPSCGATNSAQARFCSSCGAPLRASDRREERKLVSVLFVDLVDFTARADRTDPEDVREALQLYHAEAKRRIEQHGGVLEKFIGDAVMAVFGAPTAHGDDAERAVRAGLRVLEGIGEQATPSRPATSSIRPRGSSRQRPRGGSSSARQHTARLGTRSPMRRLRRSTQRGKPNPYPHGWRSSPQPLRQTDRSLTHRSLVARTSWSSCAQRGAIA